MLKGLDVSHHNPATYDLTGIDFLIARASYGTTADMSAEAHLARGRARGLVLGVYHWTDTRPGAPEPEEQAAFFITRAAILSGPLLLAQDVEPLDPKHPDPPARVRSFAHRFWLGARARACRKVGTYGGDYLGLLDLPAEMAADPLWRSDWTAPYPAVRPWAAWTILQYAVEGTPKLDRNRFDGTVHELRAAFGLPPLPSPYPESSDLLRVLRVTAPMMAGADVRSVQIMLNARAAGLTTDGKYGPLTSAAVKVFQATRGLVVSGVVEAETWAALVGG